MSFSVRISADLVPVEAGATVPLGIEIANRSDEADRFELEIEGLDPDWTAVPVPTFAVDPRDIQTEKVFFKPPRVSESLAGTFPFVVKVRSLVTGEQRTAQGILEIKPYHHLAMELTPKKGVYSPVRKTNAFQATIMNLGNTEHTLQVFATDPEDALAYEIEPQQVSVSPGQTRSISISAKPTASRSFAGSRLHGFSVSARSLEHPSVACSAQAQLEERPAFSPAALAVAFLFLLVFAGWWALRPQPPHMLTLSLIPPNATRGQEVKVAWTAANATSVRLVVDGRTIEDLKPNDEYRFVAGESGMVEAVAVREGKVSEALTRVLTVTDPAPVPDPVISRFDINPKRAKLGEPLVVTYKLGPNVEKATLEPAGINLDLSGEQRQISADIRGSVKYTLVAENKGKVVRKTVTVNVIEESDANIVVFRAEPAKLPPGGGRVAITWQLTGSVRRELKAGAERLELEESGTREFLIDQTLEFTITGYDAEGRTVTKTIKVEVEPFPAEPPPSTGGDPPPPR